MFLIKFFTPKKDPKEEIFISLFKSFNEKREESKKLLQEEKIIESGKLYIELLDEIHSAIEKPLDFDIDEMNDEEINKITYFVMELKNLYRM